MLPDPDLGHLKRSPIELVVFELLLPPGAEPLGAAQMLEFKEAVAARGWTAGRFESAFRRNLKLALEPGEMLADEARGWTLIGREDPPVTVSVFPAVVNIQANGYSSWHHALRPTLDAVITTVHEVLEPPAVQRIGLRYINRLVDPEARRADHWRGKVSDEFLGAALHPVLGPALAGSQQQLDLAWEGGVTGVIRHGAFKDGAVSNSFSYLLDVDISDANGGNFTPGRVLSVVDGLQLMAVSVFQQSLTGQYLEVLRGRTDVFGVPSRTR
ncbi:TIGR04255 family protein [Streptomyces sp. NPDC059785]|uniref:TIGR04255 family protein n=1 Tax=Streptomyces sp. NPDC059785 TaxID=3346945 RepID=UPI00365F4DBB